MNKILIPTILTATILIAGMFAFMPVEKASTVHTTIGTNINDQDRAITIDVLDTTGGLADATIVPAGGNIIGTLIVGSTTAVCLVEDTTGPTTIANPAAGEATVIAVDNTANTPAGFGANEGLRFDLAATGRCQITLILDSQTG